MSDEPIRYPLKYGPWVIQERSIVYQDPWLKVTRDIVARPDGSPGSYGVSHMKPGVCVLAIDGDGICHLTEEFHYAVGRVTLECVSGGIEPGEGVFETAQRELAEELGLCAGKWTDLGMVDPFTAIALSPTSLWLAEDLSRTTANPEVSEIIRHVEIPFAEVFKKTMAAEITHAPSVALILKAWIMKTEL
ncbi:MAG: NUDIX hydrolase [Planctomycetota bacterium]|nr:NUDIX hydrolase [Planctomycetota bacterium]RLS25573.1 MAG: NUDIX hydrolase [Planctomycetota bacterium]